MVFVKFEDNYADEFDVEGFSIYNTKEEFLLELYKTWLFDYIESDECPNVDKYFDSDLGDFLEGITVKDLKPLINESKEYYSINPKEFYFGTNEANIYESFNEFKECFTIKKITDEEYKAIKRVIGETYGIFPMEY